MKNPEDIARMSSEELEKAAAERNDAIPAGLHERLEDGLAGLAAASEAVERGRRRRRFRAPALALAGVSAVAALLLTLPTPGGPEDSFDDPLLAYAEVEKSFSLISEKLGKGADMFLEAAPEFNRPKEILDKITGK